MDKSTYRSTINDDFDADYDFENDPHNRALEMFSAMNTRGYECKIEEIDGLNYMHSVVLVLDYDIYGITARFNEWICIRINCQCKSGCDGYHYIYIREKLGLFEMVITVVHGKIASDYFVYRLDEFNDYVYRDDFTYGMVIDDNNDEYTYVDTVVIKNNDGFDASIEEGDLFGALHLWRGMNWKQEKIKSARND